MKKKILSMLLVAVMIVSFLPASISAAEMGNCSNPIVSIVDKDTYYDISVNLNGEKNHKEFGKEYAKAIKQALPQYEELLDTYLDRLCDFFAMNYGISKDDFYAMMLSNAKDIFPQLDRAYQDEIIGLACSFTPDADNIPGDQKISYDEMVTFNLLSDAVRVFECSAAAVFGSRSENGKTIAARNLDWLDVGIMSKLSCVLTLHNKGKSICLIGYMGNLSAISAFNKSGVFGAVLDTSMSNANPADSYQKRSYCYDLRHAIENEKTLKSVANYMKDSNKKYIYNHLVFLADKTSSKVLENNFSGTGSNMQRALRSWDSELNDDISWGISNAIGCVNCFMLKGNHDDYTGVLLNTSRWESLKREMESKGEKVSLDELQQVITYSSVSGPGSVYNGDLYWGDSTWGNAQTVIFVPATKELKVAFRPRNNVLLARPEFAEISVAF